MADSSWLSELEQALCEALPRSKAYPPDYELLLTLLSQVHEQDSSDRGNSLAIAYTRRLQDHVVNVRHRQFFKILSSRDVLSNQSAPALEYPVYDFTASIFEVDESTYNTSEVSSHRSDASFADLEVKLSRKITLSHERALRSIDYCVAENWAVAAELGSNDDGAHCFLVGTLAHKISSALGFDLDRCLEVELACRLHDIGKVGIPAAMAKKVLEGDWHHSLYLRDHSAVGERLLQSSSDPVLILGASVARSHHEWWNGFGFPDALRKEDIPIEARICAVASEYSALVGGKTPRTRWSHEEALSQIATMAGVQFDPSIVQALVGIKDLYACIGGMPAATNKLKGNRLKLAKTKLDACVASI